MRPHQIYDRRSNSMEDWTSRTCKKWQEGYCSYGAKCRYNHFEPPVPNRGRQAVMTQESPRFTTDNPRPDTPVPTNQRSQTLRLESPAETAQRSSVAAANTMPSSLVSTSSKQVPSSTPQKEETFIYVETDTGSKRYLKTECAFIRQEIEKHYRMYPSDPLRVLRTASEQLREQINICRSVMECWTYWKFSGKQDSKIAGAWPPNPEAVDAEMMMSHRKDLAMTSSHAITPDQAALRAAPLAATEPGAIKSSDLWPKEQKEYLCQVIKNKKRSQYSKSKEVFWQEVGEEMTEAGYLEGYRMFRDYWDKHGRKEFNYDELPYFEGLVTTSTVKQRNTARRTGPRGNRFRSGQGLSRDQAYTTKLAMEQLSLRRNEEGRRGRRRSLTPDSPIRPIKNRKRQIAANRNSSARPTKKRVPSSPQQKIPKTPKAPVPQTSDRVLQNLYSDYHVKDKTAKMASEFPLPLIAPATGEVFYPSLIPNEITPSEPPRQTIQPVAPSTTITLTTEQPLRSTAKPSQTTVRKSSSRVLEKDTESNQPDTQDSARIPHNDSTRITRPFDFVASPQGYFPTSPEPTESVSRPRIQKATMAKGAPSPAIESNEQETRGSDRSEGVQAQVKPPVITAPSDVSSSAISRTQTEIRVADTSVITDTMDDYGHQNHSYQAGNDTNHQNGTSDEGLIDYSDGNTIFVNNNETPAEKITIREEPTLVPLVMNSTRSRFSETPSLTDDNSTTSDEPTTADEEMVDAQQPSQETSMNEIKDGYIPKKTLQEAMHYADSKISNMINVVLKIKGENERAEKKIADVEQEINTLTAARDALKERHAGKVAEIQKIEEQLRRKEKYKQAIKGVINCTEAEKSKEQSGEKQMLI